MSSSGDVNINKYICIQYCTYTEYISSGSRSWMCSAATTVVCRGHTWLVPSYTALRALAKEEETRVLMSESALVAQFVWLKLDEKTSQS